MTSFRRAQLRGSDELFRPTRPGEEAASAAAGRSAPTPSSQPAGASAVAAPPQYARSRLTT